MTNSENKRAKMTSDRVDDTKEAVDVGKLPDGASNKNNLDDSLKDTTNLQINISGIAGCEMSHFDRVFYKKLNMAIEKEAKEKVEDSKLREALLWPGGEEWRVKSETPLWVKKQSPLREVMFP
ncbi:uncharacterized protein EAE98_000348 [Botrytis deweyae]|uniref:Uncharacterized protein n=1 Tax=Botrytis deweyae TaxID=2478750 RepID=A0ABQ7J2P5_9HELO|nr:uncharacterized protein EAE98_000348 [Botrytis deweyae]KAF7940221.1 hypothetical protein EAE98_000348 [Botrytis deweyae]